MPYLPVTPVKIITLTKEEYEESIAMATNCLNWAEQKISGPNAGAVESKIKEE